MMAWRRASHSLLALAATCVAGIALAAPEPASSRLDARKAVERSEAAIGRTIGAYHLTDSKGQPLALAALFDRPLVVSLVYSACSSVCPVATQHLIDAVAQANKLIGSDRFSVLTVGFDARRDTPNRMAQFASIQGIKAPNWIVASADSGTITALLRDLGFSYVSVAGGFDHVTQTTIIEQNGRIYRHVYGDEFPIPVFMEPLKEAVYGNKKLYTIGGILDHIKYICTTFDPGAGRYRIDYGLVFGSVIGALSLLLFGGLIAREWMRTTRRA
jgi:protein SCO1/2